MYRKFKIKQIADNRQKWGKHVHRNIGPVQAVQGELFDEKSKIASRSRYEQSAEGRTESTLRYKENVSITVMLSNQMGE